MKNFIKYTMLLIALACSVSLSAQGKKKGGSSSEVVAKKIGFPLEQPSDANVNKPYSGAELSVTPAGFCWWRADDYGKVNYILSIYDASGKEVFTSEPILDCAYVPSKTLPAGQYSWIVRAYDKSKKLVAERPSDTFTILKGAYQLPKPDMAKLIANVPLSHPRLIFTKEALPELRKELSGVSKEFFDLIKEKADQGLREPLAKEPKFHTLDEKGSKEAFAQKRTDYRVDYHHYGDVYLDVVEPLSFIYMITGEKKYGEAAKKHLLRLTELPIGGDGPLVLYDSKFDEVTLQIADALPRAYDWAYDAFSAAEREKMEGWMVSLADSLLKRMSGSQRDFFFYSGESHDGRIPPYMMNFAIALANHPQKAAQWMDFAITSSLSVYPQWASDDGGWAEGVDYALTYSGRFIPPIEALYRMTGFNLWERPFYKNFPYFLTYCLSPIGEVSPFGDSEDQGVKGGKSAIINSMLKFYAERNKDAQMKWWADMFNYDKADVDRSMKGLIQDIMLHGNVKAERPIDIKQERIFKGIGWAAIHSDITNPENDLFLMFKSSPFGPESHSHLDQNSFVIMKGGKALAIPAGSRYPQHGSPFHTKYTRLSLAHNTLLFNGKGQVDKDPTFNAHIFADKATKNISYVAGDAHRAYERGLKRFDRHMVMLRPSVILLLDDVELGKEGAIDWLLHGKEQFVIDQAKQTLISNGKTETMSVEFISPKPLAFSQDDKWPMAPKTGYPMVKTADPVNQWHFTAKVEGVDKYRIATVMTIGKETQTSVKPYVTKDGADIVIIFADGAVAKVKMNTGSQTELMDIVYTPAKGDKEIMKIEKK